MMNHYLHKKKRAHGLWINNKKLKKRKKKNLCGMSHQDMKKAQRQRSELMDQSKNKMMSK